MGSVSRSQRRQNLLRPLRSPSSVPPSSPSSPSSPTRRRPSNAARRTSNLSPTSNTARRAKQQQQQQQRTRVLLLFLSRRVMLSFYISFICSTLPNTAAPKQKRRLGTRIHTHYIKCKEKRREEVFCDTHANTRTL